MFNDMDSAIYELMGEFGTIATYEKNVPGAYTPGVGITPTTTTYQVEAILTDLTLRANGLTVQYGTQIVAGDKEVYVRPPKTSAGADAITVDPSSDFITIGGVKYKIVNFKEINPTGDGAILYSLYVRR